MVSPSSTSRAAQEPPGPRLFPGASSAKPSDSSYLTSPLAIARAEGRHLRCGSTLRRAEGSSKSWHPPCLSAIPVAPTPTSILAAFPLPVCALLTWGPSILLRARRRAEAGRQFKHSWTQSLAPRPERPDFLFRADFWHVGPRSGGIAAPTTRGIAVAHDCREPDRLEPGLSGGRACTRRVPHTLALRVGPGFLFASNLQLKT